MTEVEQQTFHLMTAVISAPLWAQRLNSLSSYEVQLRNQLVKTDAGAVTTVPYDIAITSQAIANLLIRSNLAALPDVAGE